MTPKEKAIELVGTFAQYTKVAKGISGFDLTDAIKCAIICVNEILNVTHEDSYNRKDNRSMFDNQYWQEVKSELKKL